MQVIAYSYKISYCQLLKKHIKARYFANLLHENLY